MSVDEVAFGLALQSMTPFRFSCNRLLMRRLPELQLPVYNLIRLLNPLVAFPILFYVWILGIKIRLNICDYTAKMSSCVSLFTQIVIVIVSIKAY